MNSAFLVPNVCGVGTVALCNESLQCSDRRALEATLPNRSVQAASYLIRKFAAFSKMFAVAGRHMADELFELIDEPVERMDVEYKSWLDLTLPKTRADLARHIAAISNYGGGMIVFGINDDGHSCGPAPPGFKIDHDLVASITRKYLEPSIHCDVRWVQSALGVDHALVQVPSHGATPICAKVNGPEAKGRPEGIVSGVHYLRKPGPESSPIVLASEWRDVIRRCALHDRSAILAAISAALAAAGAKPGSVPDDRLRSWAAAADKRFVSLLVGKDFAAPLDDCRVQFSYRIETEDRQTLPAKGFTEALRQVASEVDDHVRSGWSLFFVFNGEATAPRWAADPEWSESDFLETNLVDPTRSLGFDLWRISTDGLATAIREFWEDTPDFRLQPRTTLDRRILTKSVGELVRHAEAFGRRFESPMRVEFLCRWQGIAGRRLHELNGPPLITRAASADVVVTSGSWPFAELGPKFAPIVEGLVGKVARTFDWENFDAAWIEGEMSAWRRS